MLFWIAHIVQQRHQNQLEITGLEVYEYFGTVPVPKRNWFPSLDQTGYPVVGSGSWYPECTGYTVFQNYRNRISGNTNIWQSGYQIYLICGFTVVERDALFIPAGWDSLTKIAILYENIRTFFPDQPYSDVIKSPKLAKRKYEPRIEVVAESEQEKIN